MEGLREGKRSKNPPLKINNPSKRGNLYIKII